MDEWRSPRHPDVIGPPVVDRAGNPTVYGRRDFAVADARKRLVVVPSDDDLGGSRAPCGCSSTPTGRQEPDRTACGPVFLEIVRRQLSG